MGSILLKNLTISNRQNDVFIDKGLIQKIEPAGACILWDLAGDVEVMDCSGKVGIPGFINMHSHAAMSLMRGVGEDMIFEDWIRKIWEIEKNIDREYIYWAVKVACLEMIRTGTTTFNDQYWHFDVCHKVATEMGLRTAVGYDVLDRCNAAEASRIKEECVMMTEEALKWKDSTVYALSFHAIYTVSEAMMIWTAEFARQHGLRLHIHLCETRKEVEDCKRIHGGLTPVEYLDAIGVLGPNVIAAHTLWISEHDIEILAARGVHCVHNINSNTKLCSGYRFLYNELRDAGVNVCLGTDGSASSNNLDMLEAMKTTALFQKSWRNDPCAMPLNELLDCATIHGARALGLDSGVLEVGKSADINIIDTNNSFFLSPGEFLANLVYSAHSDCIDSVICNGKFVMRNRQIEGEAEILNQARKIISKLT